MGDVAMQMTNFLIRLGLLPCLLLTVVPPVVARDLDHDDARELVQHGEILPLENLLTQVKKTYPGKILEVDLERKAGKLIYELEVLDAEGKVWELRFDAASGKLLQQELED